jgi:hypothetical protein
LEDIRNDLEIMAELDKLGGSSSDMNSLILRGQLSKITPMSSRAAWLTSSTCGT